MAASRAARPHALHDTQQQYEQRKKPRREQIWVFRQSELFWSGNIAGRGGQVWSLVDTPGVDRNYYFLVVLSIVYFEVYQLRQG